MRDIELLEQLVHARSTAGSPRESHRQLDVSAAVRNGIRLSDWRTTPIFCARSAARSVSPRVSVATPPIATRPESGRRSPAMSESSVDLPLPGAR